ncbi:MAG: riboflavin synthase [Lachnospiraceae bacterium]|nr:riboflavin synthase [Lachnospiraceae bacterium]
MFTGIVEEIGHVVSIRHGPASVGLTIKADKIFRGPADAGGGTDPGGLCGVAVGDSICTNGVCLTATSVDPEARVFTADVMNETLKRSTLGELKAGSPVDLERAMAANGRFGGHIVSGHIDGVGRISAMHRDDIAIWYEIKASPDIMKYVVEKGSIAIEGISLTVAGLRNGGFAVSVIPHTQEETVLTTKHVNSRVNLECDIVGKYVERFTGSYTDLLKRSIGS